MHLANPLPEQPSNLGTARLDERRCYILMSCPPSAVGWSIFPVVTCTSVIFHYGNTMDHTSSYMDLARYTSRVERTHRFPLRWRYLRACPILLSCSSSQSCSQQKCSSLFPLELEYYRRDHRCHLAAQKGALDGTVSWTPCAMHLCTPPDDLYAPRRLHR